jgi:hypothetical protein
VFETIAKAMAPILWIPPTFQKALESGKCRSNKGRKTTYSGLAIHGKLAGPSIMGQQSSS